jgi:hypothetical protein
MFLELRRPNSMLVVAAIVSPRLHKSKHLYPLGIRSHIMVAEEFILPTRKLPAPSERPSAGGIQTLRNGRETTALLSHANPEVVLERDVHVGIESTGSIGGCANVSGRLAEKAIALEGPGAERQRGIAGNQTLPMPFRGTLAGVGVQIAPLRPNPPLNPKSSASEPLPSLFLCLYLRKTSSAWHCGARDSLLPGGRIRLCTPGLRPPRLFVEAGFV